MLEEEIIHTVMLHRKWHTTRSNAKINSSQLR